MELSIREGVIIGILFLLGLIIVLAYGEKLEAWLYKKIIRTREEEGLE